MRIPIQAAALILVLFATTTFAQTEKPTQAAVVQTLTITAKVTDFDLAKRRITLVGPFDNEIVGIIADDVQGIDKIKVGDMLSLTYYEAIAAAVQKKGEPQPLFSATDAAATAYPGKVPKGVTSVTKSFTIVSVDPDTNTLVLQDSAGKLLTRDVKRPEFAAKLKMLRPGDQVDVTYSDAIITNLYPVAPGEEPKATMKISTLVINKGEVVKRMNNTLMIRNEKGRMIKVTVDSDSKFLLDGKEMTVYDLKEGQWLTHTALHVTGVAYTD
jgi:hypothetical protein